MIRKTNRRQRTLDLAVHSAIETLEPRRLFSAGDLDPSFSGDGLATVNFGDGITAHSSAVAVQSDGKTVVAGGAYPKAALARFNVDGALDTSFGGTGKVLIDLGGTPVTAMVVQPDGKIVVATEGGVGDDPLVARFLSNGTLDSSFSGDGKMTIDWGILSVAHNFYALAVQSDGKILVVGANDTGVIADDDFAIARINPNGTLDNSFDGDGKRSIDLGDWDSACSVTIDYNGTPATNSNYGDIILAGVSHPHANHNNSSMAVLRLNANGSLDSGFSGDGKLLMKFPGKGYNWASGVLLDSAGKIILGGSVATNVSAADFDFALARLLPNGALDTSFGGNGFGGTGQVVTDLGSEDLAGDLIFSADNAKYLLAGRSGEKNAVAKYATNGLLDGLFGNNGKVITPGTGGIFDLAVGPGRRFVATGARDPHDQRSGTGFLTARYLDQGANLVYATPLLDPTGAETGQNPASFFVYRSERLPTPTRVYLKVGGSATASTLFNFKGKIGDYTTEGITFPFDFFGGSSTPYVDIPANQTYAIVTITPVDDAAAEGDERAVFTILPDPHYEVGAPQAASLLVKDNDGGSIAGHVFFDGNGNGVEDDRDAPMSGVTVWGDLDNDKALDPSERYTTTDSSGNYILANLPAGAYVVRQKAPAGRVQSSPAGGAGIAVALAQDQNVTGKNFGNKRAIGSISGTVYNDLDGDGVKDALETGIAGRTVFIDANNNSLLDSSERRAITNSSGTYVIPFLPAGTYRVREVRPSGWTQTSPLSNGAINVVLGAGQSLTGKNFFIRPTPAGTARISGNVFHDLNRNGIKETGDTGLGGWVVYIDLDNDKVLDTNERRMLTDAAGNYIINSLAAGTYKVRVVLKTGYVQTLPGSGFGQNATLTAGQHATGKNFGVDN